MAEETRSNSMKPQIIAASVIVLLFVTGLVVFGHIQNQSQAEQTSQNTETSQISPVSSEAGSLGKNEVGLTDNNFDKEVLGYKGVFMVEFYLSTCPHCRNVAADVTAASDELAGKAKVGKIEASQNTSTANKYDIGAVPTFVVFENGKEKERAEGERSKQDLIDMISKYLN